MNQAAQTPPIDVNTMTHFFDNFRGKILGCSTNWHGNTVLTIKNLRKSKIGQLNIALIIDNDIFRFQTELHKNVLSVNNLVFVQLL